MTLSDIRQILHTQQIELTRSLGQNFLHDGNQIKRIVRKGLLTKTDRVLEIGPGLGPLTECLLAEAGQVLAIEMDRRLAKLLRERLQTTAGFTLIEDDALACLKRRERDWTGWKMISNLPFSVASPILVELAQTEGCPELIVATVQIEVARRLAAKPGTPDYGVLTLLVQMRYEPQEWFRIPADCFFPPPDVASACITLVRRPQRVLLPEHEKTFAKIVKRGFSQRRKMMFKLLRADWPEDRLLRAYETVGLSLKIRAEALSLDQLARFTQALVTV